MSNNSINTLKQNLSWIFIGNLIYALSQWGIIVVMARFGDAVMVGQFSLGLALTAPIILFFNIQLRSVIATDSNDQYSFGEYFANRITLLCLALFIIVLISLVGPYSGIVSLIVVLVGISKVIESLSEVSHGYLQKIERMDYVGKSQIIKALLSVLSVGIILYFYENLVIALLGLITVWIIRFITYDISKVRNFTSIKPIFNKNIKRIFLLGLPLGLVSILNSLNTNIPRYFLEYHVGLEELGYFSAIVYLLVVGNLLIRPLSLVAAPRLAKYYNSGNLPLFLKMNMYLMIGATLLGGTAILIAHFFGELILILFYGHDYAKYHDILFLIMIGSALSYYTTFLNTSLVAARAFRMQPIINFITSIVGVFSAVLLIPVYQIEGATYVLLVIFFTQFMGSLLLFLKVVILLNGRRKHE